MKEKNQCPDFAAILRNADPNEKLLNQIVSCFYNSLSGFALYKCGNAAIAEDTLQDTMLTMMKSLQNYRGDAPLDAWLRALVVSSCSRSRRGRKNDPNLHSPLIDDEKDDTSGKTEDDLILKENFNQLLSLIDDLGEPNRSLLLEHESEDASIESLAGKYRLTPEAVKSRLKRSRAIVREKLMAVG